MPRTVNHQLSHIAALALSFASCCCFSPSRSKSRFFFSCSFTDFWYATCSSVCFGALMPRPAAMSLRATASVFSGRFPSFLADEEDASAE